MTQAAHAPIELSLFLSPDVVRTLELLAGEQDVSITLEWVIRAMARLYEVDINNPTKQPKRGRPIWLENEQGSGYRQYLP